MRKLIAGFAAVIVIALSALTLTPQGASAQGFSITFGTGQPPMVRHFDDRRHYGHRPRHEHRLRHDHRPRYDRDHYDRRHSDRRSYRHAPRRHYARDCVVRVQRFWDGYGWVSERRRTCR